MRTYIIAAILVCACLLVLGSGATVPRHGSSAVQMPLPSLDLKIYDANGGSTDRGDNPGAFGIVNENDTDSDGTADLSDNNVTAEVDLMRLVIGKPNPDLGGSVALAKTGPVVLWTASTKIMEVTETSFPTSKLPRTVWVEVSDVTGARDIVFTGSYLAASDTVKATGGRVRLTDNDGGDALPAYYLGDDNIFVEIHDALANTNAGSKQTISVTVKDQVGGSGDSETISLTETDNDTGVFRNLPDGNGFGLANDNLTNEAGTLITEKDRVIRADYKNGLLSKVGTMELRDNEWPFTGDKEVRRNFGSHQHDSNDEVHHTGLDIGKTAGTDVLCVQNGRVTSAAGGAVTIKSVYKIDDDHIYFRFLHMTNLEYAAGDRAHVYEADGTTREVVGEVDEFTSGGFRIDHLHFKTQDGSDVIADSINPLTDAYDGLDPENHDPAFGPVYFRRDGTNNYIAKQGNDWILDGKVDICIEITDDLGGSLDDGQEADGRYKGRTSVPYTIEYAIYDAAGENMLEGWHSTHTFDEYDAGVSHRLYDVNKETEARGGEKFGYVFVVTHCGLDESKCWDTTGYGDGDYTVKVRATDTAGNTETTSIAVEVDNP